MSAGFRVFVCAGNGPAPVWLPFWACLGFIEAAAVCFEIAHVCYDCHLPEDIQSPEQNLLQATGRGAGERGEAQAIVHLHPDDGTQTAGRR